MIELAAKREDKDAELSYRVRLGEVYESRLGNVEKAIDVYQRILEIDPGDAGGEGFVLGEERGHRRPARRGRDLQAAGQGLQHRPR